MEELLKNDDKALNIDAEYTLPALKSFYVNSKRRSKILIWDYPAFKVNYQYFIRLT